MFKRLLVPVDGSELSDKAMKASIDLAHQLGATVVGFVAEPLQPMGGDIQPRVLWEEEAREHEARTRVHASKVLGRFSDMASQAGVAFEGFHDQVPRVDRAIIQTAESRDCDVIVMVTHGRGAFGEFLFGSHTKAVLAGSNLPLLVLH